MLPIDPGVPFEDCGRDWEWAEIRRLTRANDQSFRGRAARPLLGLFEELRRNSATRIISGPCSAIGPRTCAIRNSCRLASSYLDYPFANRLFPGSLDALSISANGAQPSFFRWRRGLSAAQGLSLRSVRGGRGRALIYIHKDQELEDVEKRYPAQHYVLVDDKCAFSTP